MDNPYRRVGDPSPTAAFAPRTSTCGVRRLGVGAHPPPAARPWGRQLGSPAHMLWVRVCGCGDPALALWLACPAGRCVPRGWREVARGGGSSRRCEGRLGLGALPLPVARPWGRQPGPIARVSWARGARVWGPGTDPSVHALASWRRALRGGRRASSGGAPRAFVRGVWG